MRKIVLVTDTRAEYGILKNILYKIRNSEKLELFLIVTGTHLLEKYGMTVNEIEKDGFEIFERIVPLKEGNKEIRISLEMSYLMSKLSYSYQKIRPDILLLFGDRYEMLAAAATAVAMHIPIAHISGGEITQGAMDEQIRHAITKMAHIHFPGAEAYAKNIMKMGEESWRVFQVGDPGIENIKNLNILNKNKLEEDLKIEINKNTLLVTYHPVTLELNQLAYQMEHLIYALRQYQGTKIITYPNSDEGSEYIIKCWKDFAAMDQSVCLIPSLGIIRYISLMKYCGAVVGNSSSAIVEAPFLKIPTVNIGTRQQGRLMADTIISCKNESSDISRAITKVLSREFSEIIKNSKSLYGEGDTSNKIVTILEKIPLGEKLIKKKLEWN